MTKSAPSPRSANGLIGEERLGRRAALELDELRRPARAGSARQRDRAASRRAPPRSRSAANSRFGETSRWTQAAAIGAEDEEQCPLEPAADPARLEQYGCRDHGAAVCTCTSWSRTCAISCASTPSSSAGVQAATQPVLTATAELRTPRPVAAASGSPSGMRYRRGFAIPARAASRSTVECSSGASPSGNSRAPIIPSATRSRSSRRPPRQSSAQKTKIDRPPHSVEQPADEARRCPRAPGRGARP